MTSSINPNPPYWKTRILTSLDSYEGVPDWFEPRPHGKPGKGMAHEILDWAGRVVPGICLAVGIAFVGAALSRWAGHLLFGLRESPISPILIAVLLGLLLRNTIGVPAAYEAGLKLCLKTVLRIGIVLLGLRLSLVELGRIGLTGLPVVIGCVIAALLATTLVSRLIDLPSRMASLIAVGTSICGVSAIVAMGPAIQADEDEVSYSVACITLFGLIALIAYPFLAHWIFNGNAQSIGLFLGTAIHDTSQVTGAGLMYQQNHPGSAGTLDTAVVVKLVRNLLMAAVIPLVAIVHHRNAVASRKAVQSAHVVLPLFVIGFVMMAILRSIGDWSEKPFGFMDLQMWKGFQGGAGLLATWMLAAAMASVGLATNLTKLKSLGYKPMLAGFVAAAATGAASVILIRILDMLQR